MYRSIRATVVAATALTAGLMTMSPTAAAKPEPVSFSGSFLGGAADESIVDAVAGPDGSSYLAMFLKDGDFPADPGGSKGGWDGLVVKLGPDGDTVWAATIGGSGDEDVRSIALGPDGHVVLVGRTESMDFPTTPGALDSTNTVNDGFVVRLDGATGAVDWSTLIGGSAQEELLDVAVDGDNRIWVAGDTQSANYPVTQLSDGAFAGGGEAVLTAFDPNGSLRFSTFYGGSDWDAISAIAFGPDGRLYGLGDFPDWNPGAPTTTLGDVDGSDDNVVLRWTMGAATPVLDRATIVGGQGNDYGSALSVDGTGAVTFAGYTSTAGLPMVDAFQSELGDEGSAYLVRLDAAGENIVWSTYYGGSSNWIYPLAVRTDAWGATYVAGYTKATDGQQVHAVQDGNAGGYDGFLAKFAPDGRLAFSTYLGGTGFDQVGAFDLDRAGVRFFGVASGPEFAGQGTVSGPADGVVGHLDEIAHVLGLKSTSTAKDRTPTFRFTVDLVGSRTQCKVDKALWKPCPAKGFTTKKLAPGKHTVQVRAFSGPGRVAPAARATFRVVG